MPPASPRRYLPYALAGLAILISAFVYWIGAPATTPVDYSTQVKPILNRRCIACHGGVKKNGGISFLFRDEALASGDSGRPAIVPGRPGRSELIRRIQHPDPAQRMPSDGPPLTPEEIDVLTRWIAEGAEWGQHWAYAPIERPVVPQSTVFAGGVSPEASVTDQSPIDRFVHRRLAAASLEPAPAADCATLARRVSLDLTGLPPTPEAVARFCADPSDAAYSEWVDSLLASPAYGEHWAAHWLDLARYADTKGFERDAHRDIWLYRDWLIRAFQRDLPYDSFTVYQLAGDLLPNPTRAQYTATAFHRNTMSNDEGGTDNEEYRVQAILDRVNTTWAVWLGTTMSCVQCHSHPYDPIRHADYYRSYAFFNNTRDEDTHHDSPRLVHYRGEDSLAVAAIRDYIRQLPDRTDADRERYATSVAQLLRITEPKVHPHYFDFLDNSAHGDTKSLLFYPNGLVRLPLYRIGRDTQLLIQFDQVAEGGWLDIRERSPDGPLLSEIRLRSDYAWRQVFVPIASRREPADLYFRYRPPDNSSATLGITWLLFYEPPDVDFYRLRSRITALLNERTSPSVPIQIENNVYWRRTTMVFERGNWLVPGDTVRPGVPDVLPALATEGRTNRLDLARWIVDPRHPLTARVAVNRFWEQLFGVGLVETAEDFGSQGTPPSHPELLDWLAYEFMHTHEWRVKSLLREIVLSRTYRQSSRVSPEKVAQDPYNRLLSRGPRVRLTAEQVRDQALAVSGLLSQRRFGPSVMPPQPPGVWNVVYNGAEWTTSDTTDRYRRALYTYWRRTSPYPSLVSFDAPSREFCVVRRIRTNTPLQALVGLNDPVYWEAAQALADRSLLSAKGAEERIAAAYRLAVLRPPTSAALAELHNVYREALAEYRADPLAARQVLSPQDKLLYTDGPPLATHDHQPEQAALTVVANVILNLDAFLTKE